VSSEVARPKTWLLRLGWRRNGLNDPSEGSGGGGGGGAAAPPPPQPPPPAPSHPSPSAGRSRRSRRRRIPHREEAQQPRHGERHRVDVGGELARQAEQGQERI